MLRKKKYSSKHPYRGRPFNSKGGVFFLRQNVFIVFQNDKLAFFHNLALPYMGNTGFRIFLLPFCPQFLSWIGRQNILSVKTKTKTKFRPHKNKLSSFSWKPETSCDIYNKTGIGKDRYRKRQGFIKYWSYLNK